LLRRSVLWPFGWCDLITTNALERGRFLIYLRIES